MPDLGDFLEILKSGIWKSLTLCVLGNWEIRPEKHVLQNACAAGTWDWENRDILTFFFRNVTNLQK
jgi:hypothetical protein